MAQSEAILRLLRMAAGRDGSPELNRTMATQETDASYGRPTNFNNAPSDVPYGMAPQSEGERGGELMSRMSSSLMNTGGAGLESEVQMLQAVGDALKGGDPELVRLLQDYMAKSRGGQ